MVFNKPKRPINQCGKDNAFSWYTDTNEIILDCRELGSFNSFLENSGFKGVFNNYNNGNIDVKDVIKGLTLSGTDYVAMFLVWAELPEMVENIVVNQFKGVLRDKAILTDKLKLKLAKLR